MPRDVPDSSEGREAIHEGDPNVDFGGLAIRVSCSDALAEGLKASHLRLEPDSDVVSRPLLPECPDLVPGGTAGFVSGDRGRAVFFPRPAVLADRDYLRSSARQRLAVALNAMLSRLAFAVAKEVDPGAIHQQIRWAHRHDDTGSGRQASFAADTALCSQAPSNSDPPS